MAKEFDRGIHVGCAVRPVEVDGLEIGDEACEPVRVASHPTMPWCVILHHSSLPNGGITVRAWDMAQAVKRAAYTGGENG